MDVAPIAESQVAGFYTDDGSIILAQRVIGLSHYGGQSRDTVVKIEIEGVVHCFCKAKYDDARAIGVKHDWSGDAYFIDRLNPSNSEE